MTTLAAHQPAWMPWAGYLERIALSDVFVILAGVQYERGSYTNRNQIMGPAGRMWLTVPVKSKGHLESSIATTEVDRLKPWRRKHLETIRHAYAKAPRFRENWPKLQAEYERYGGKLLTQVCFSNLAFWLKEYSMKENGCKIVVNSAPKVKTDELIALCKEYGADTYLSGKFGKSYLVLDRFKKAGIEVRFHEPEYNPLSVLDSWMTTKQKPFSLLGLMQMTRPSDAQELSSGMLPTETQSTS